jgi:hypothetical protein
MSFPVQSTIHAESMSTATMTQGIAGASPRVKARIAGLLCLAITVAAPFGELVVREPL